MVVVVFERKRALARRGGRGAGVESRGTCWRTWVFVALCRRARRRCVERWHRGAKRRRIGATVAGSVVGVRDRPSVRARGKRDRGRERTTVDALSPRWARRVRAGRGRARRGGSFFRPIASTAIAAIGRPSHDENERSGGRGGPSGEREWAHGAAAPTRHCERVGPLCAHAGADRRREPTRSADELAGAGPGRRELTAEEPQRAGPTMAGGGAAGAVVGAILGQQTGRTVEVTNSFELAITDGGHVDREYFVTKQTQCAVLPRSAAVAVAGRGLTRSCEPGCYAVCRGSPQSGKCSPHSSLSGGMPRRPRPARRTSVSTPRSATDAARWPAAGGAQAHAGAATKDTRVGGARRCSNSTRAHCFCKWTPRSPRSPRSSRSSCSSPSWMPPRVRRARCGQRAARVAGTVRRS